MFQQNTVFERSILAVATSLMFATSVISPLPARGQSAPPQATHLMISNATSLPVTMYVTLQAHSAGTEDGCTNSCADLYMVTGGTATQVSATATTQASFTLASMTTYELISNLANPFAPGGAAAQNCLQGVEVTFNQPPSCPSGTVPNGVNGGEPTLNLPGTIGGATGGNAGVGEACDVTCVNGANSLIQLAITAPSLGVDPQLWTYDSTKTIPAGGSFNTTNSWVLAGVNGCDNNCSPELPGVYPFGCTQCNRFPDPAPPCGQFCASANGLGPNLGCVISRSPNLANPSGSQYGGTVQYTYTGAAIPPATCSQSPQGNIQWVKVKTYVVKDFNITYIRKPNGKLVAVKNHPFGTKTITVEYIKYHH
jgi:hypothetical protein